MNRLEKFGLATGIIGLTSDTIALTAFIGGLWGKTTTTVTTPFENFPTISATTTVREVPLVIATTLILTIIYSWLIISWVLCRRSFELRTTKNKEITENIMQRAITGFGIVTWPLLVMWLVITFQGDNPTKVEANNMFATQQAILTLTPTPIPKINPVTGDPVEQRPPTTNGVWDKTDATYLAVGVSIPIQAALGFILYWVLYSLMPVVYPDMIEFEKPEPISVKARIR
jgi:hypothetical protein